MPVPRILAIDIDGTLLGPDGTVSPRNRAALRAAQAQGVETVIATGRRHTYAMRVLRDLDLPADGALISSNGAVMRTIGAKLLHRQHMAPSTASWLCDYAGPFRDALVLTFDRVNAQGEECRGALVCETGNSLYSSIDAWMLANEPYIQQVRSFQEALLPAPAKRPGAGVAVLEPEEDDAVSAPIQAMLCGTQERMAQAEARLAAHPAVASIGEPEFPGCEIVLQRTVYPDRDLSILDILPAGCSKASALRFLAALRGCTLQDVAAVGDNWNDLAMLQAANRAFLMGNAPDALLAMAAQNGWKVVPRCEQDGVAAAVEHLLA